MKDNLTMKNELVNIDKKLNLLRDNLIEVAKNSKYFCKEIDSININNNKLKDYHEDICNIAIKIENYTEEINNLRSKIKELEKSIFIINNQYFDISKYNNSYLLNNEKNTNIEQA